MINANELWIQSSGKPSKIFYVANILPMWLLCTMWIAVHLPKTKIIVFGRSVVHMHTEIWL